MAMKGNTLRKKILRQEWKTHEKRQQEAQDQSVINMPSKPSDDQMKPASVCEDSMGPDILYDEFEKALLGNDDAPE